MSTKQECQLSEEFKKVVKSIVLGEEKRNEIKSQVWTEFITATSILSFKFWLLYFKDPKSFQDSSSDPKDLTDTLINTWKMNVMRNYEAEVNKLKKDIATEDKKFYILDEFKKFMDEIIEEIEKRARSVLSF